MPISYSIDEAQGIILEVWTGAVSVDELADFWSALLLDQRVMALRRTLVDVRESEMNVSGKDLMTLIADIVAPALKGRKWTTAIVVARPDQFGVLRQYQVFAELFSSDAIFYDYATALRWVLDQAAINDDPVVE